MSNRQIDIQLVYKEANAAVTTLMSTIQLYHDQTLKLIEIAKAKDAQILELQKNKLQVTETVPNKPDPKKK